MPNNPRSASAASVSQERRSSRLASRSGSIVGLSRETRPGSRHGSTAIQYEDLGLDDSNIEWNDPNFLANYGYDNLIDDPSHYTAPQDEFGNMFSSNYIPDASVGLLQHPFSALPGTPRMMGFNNIQHAPMLYHNAPIPFTPQLMWNQAAIPRQSLQLNANMGLPASPVSTKMKSKTSKSPSDAKVRAPLYKDDFAGYVSDEQVHQYPEPPQRLMDTYVPPYYYGMHQNQLEWDQLPTPSSPHTPVRMRRHSQSQKPDVPPPDDRTHKTKPSNAPHRSDTSLANRSSSGAPGDYHRRPSRMDPQRKMSVIKGPDYTKLEVPKIDVDKPWIRINKTTRGETTRTAKCNNFNPSEHYTHEPHPLGDWSSGRYDFKYTEHGEWKAKTMSADAIRDFILRYPEDKDKGIKLHLNIQVSPTDSARRYLSQTWTKCRFAECPTWANRTGTILHGHYRVALDERSWDQPNHDPHLMAGAYVHLYCLERFLDFEMICKKAHVYVDNRQFSREPKGRFAATLAGHPEFETAYTFVQEARKPDGNVRKIEGFEDYPLHEDYMGRPKPHADTLVCRMHEAKEATRPPAQIKQFQNRGLLLTHLIVNKGDLEVFMAEVMRKRAITARSKAKAKTNAPVGKKRKTVQIDSDDDFTDLEEDPEHALKRSRLMAEAKKKFTPCAKKAVSRIKRTWWPRTVVQPWEVDDSDSDDDFGAVQKTSSVQGQRRSSRAATRKRKDYREVEEPPLRPEQIEYLKGYVPATVGYIPPQTHNLPHDSFDTRQQEPSQHLALIQNDTPAGFKRRRSSLPLFIDEGMIGVDIDNIFDKDNEALDRRVSTALATRKDRGSSLRSSMSSSRKSSLGKRHTSFSKQPVSHKQEFDTEAPPQQVETPSRRTRFQDKAQKTKEVLGMKGGPAEKRRQSLRRGNAS
jgi:hypothetical protein